MVSLKNLVKKLSKSQSLNEEVELPVILRNPAIEVIPEVNPYHPIVFGEQQKITKMQSTVQLTPFLPNVFRLNDYFEPEPGYEATGARLLGRGSFGRAMLYRYKFFNKNEQELNADQQFIKGLCDENGLIVIKRGAISELEGKVTHYLAQYPNQYNQAVPAVVLNEQEEQETIILSRYAAFFKDTKKAKPKARYKSYSLKAFLEKMYAVSAGLSNWKDKKTGVVATDTYKNIQTDFDLMLVQLSVSMMKSIRALHSVGVYHLDVAPRNFLMDDVQREDGQITKLSALAADFGEAVQYDPATGLSYEPVRGVGPIRWLNRDVIYKNPNHYTVRTDLYAFRVSLINMLCISLGLDECAAIFVRPGENAIDNAIRRAELPSDAAALQIYLNNLKILLKEMEVLPPKRARVAIVQNFIECYGDYIAQPPWDNPVLDQKDIKKADYQAFLRANEKFFVMTLHRKLTQLNIRNLADAKIFRLVVTRLFEIEVSEEFKSLYLYSTLTGYLASDDLRAINIDKLINAVDQLHYQKLKTSLQHLQDVFKANLHYYHSAFYLKVNPFRHRFLKTSQEIFDGLGVVPKQMQSCVETLAQYAAVLTSQQKASSQEVKSIRLQTQRLREFYKKYQRYLQLALTNFERHFDEIHNNDVVSLAALQKSLAAFQRLLLPPETAELYASLLELPKTYIYLRAKSLVEQVERKIKEQTVSVESRVATSALVIKTIDEEKAPAVKKQKVITEQAIAPIAPSVEKWQKILKDKKIWTYDDSKHEIVVQPKKSRLNFVIEVETNCLVYNRNNNLANDKKFVADENKIIEKMVQVFLKTGNSAAELNGNQALCAKAAKLLQKHKKMRSIKINGEALYTAKNAAIKNTLSAPLNVFKKRD